MSDPSRKGIAVITGASSGIGAVYADRLAKRGYDLILVARNEARLRSLSARLTRETGRSIEVLPTNLNNRAELARVEAVLRDDPSITMLVNNAGTASVAPLLNADVNKMDEIIALNITALTRLTYAAVLSGPAHFARSCVYLLHRSVRITPQTKRG
jgi:short-subunit dehydrogenase